MGFIGAIEELSHDRVRLILLNQVELDESWIFTVCFDCMRTIASSNDVRNRGGLLPCEHASAIVQLSRGGFCLDVWDCGFVLGEELPEPGHCELVSQSQRALSRYSRWFVLYRMGQVELELAGYVDWHQLDDWK